MGCAAVSLVGLKLMFGGSGFESETGARIGVAFGFEESNRTSKHL